MVRSCIAETIRQRGDTSTTTRFKLFAATGIHLWSAFAVVRAQSGRNLFVSILANLCQASITADVVLIFLTSAWLYCTKFGWRGAMLAMATPLIGMGSAFAIFASWEAGLSHSKLKQ